MSEVFSDFPNSSPLEKTIMMLIERVGVLEEQVYKTTQDKRNLLIQIHFWQHTNLYLQLFMFFLDIEPNNINNENMSFKILQILLKDKPINEKALRRAAILQASCRQSMVKPKLFWELDESSFLTSIYAIRSNARFYDRLCINVLNDMDYSELYEFLLWRQASLLKIHKTGSSFHEVNAW